MPRNVGCSPHGLAAYTLRFIFTRRLRPEGRADSGRSYRVYPERFSAKGQKRKQLIQCDLGPRVHSAALFVLVPFAAQRQTLAVSPFPFWFLLHQFLLAIAPKWSIKLPA